MPAPICTSAKEMHNVTVQPDAGRTYIQCRVLRSNTWRGGHLLSRIERNLTLFTFSDLTNTQRPSSDL